MNVKQCVVITGGSSGLGLAVAKGLMKQSNMQIVLLARDEQKLQDAKQMLEPINRSNQVYVFSVDVSQKERVTQVMQRIIGLTGAIHTLINSAGVLEEGYFEQLDVDVFERVMQINFFGVLNVIKAALPYLRDTQGRIVNIASVAGLTGCFGYSAYCSAKHALVGLSRTLCLELKPQHITVQLVCPGEFDSPMVDQLNKHRTPENYANTLLIPKTSVDVVAMATLHALNHTRFMIVPGWIAYVMVKSMQFFPAISMWIAAQKIKQVYVGPPHQPSA